ncbi:MAG TPA: hypothetical protein VMZ32_00165 [Gammaproteobacteria bacterium]|nr:hypothetical protein [Gammaproteobacteria bacterium]
MYDYEIADQKGIDELNQGQLLVLDGTVHLDYSDDEQIPRVKGLLELLGEYIGN